MLNFISKVGVRNTLKVSLIFCYLRNYAVCLNQLLSFRKLRFYEMINVIFGLFIVILWHFLPI